MWICEHACHKWRLDKINMPITKILCAQMYFSKLGVDKTEYNWNGNLESLWSQAVYRTAFCLCQEEAFQNVTDEASTHLKSNSTMKLLWFLSD